MLGLLVCPWKLRNWLLNIPWKLSVECWVLNVLASSTKTPPWLSVRHRYNYRNPSWISAMTAYVYTSYAPLRNKFVKYFVSILFWICWFCIDFIILNIDFLYEIVSLFVVCFVSWFVFLLSLIFWCPEIHFIHIYIVVIF